MKNILFFSLCVILFFLQSCTKEEAYAVPENLIVGLSFEGEELHPDLSRSYFSLSDVRADVSSEEAYDGEKSLRLLSTDIENLQFVNWGFRLYNIEPGQLVRVRLRIKAVDINGEGFRVNMFAVNKDNSLYDSSFIDLNTTTDGDWKLYEMVLNKSITSEVSYIDLFMLLAAKTEGKVYFDKIEFIAE